MNPRPAPGEGAPARGTPSASPAADDGLDLHLELLRTALSGLAGQVAALETRVACLEGRTAERTPELDAPRPEGAATPPAGLPGPEAASALALGGRTLIALGGGYLLRAATESGLLPGPLGAALGLAYAALWALAGARAVARGQPASSALAGATAVLVAYPLLWESATRFGALPARGALGAAVSFAALGVLLALRHAQPWVAGAHLGAAAVLAFSLLVFSRDVLAVVLALWVLHVLTETIADRASGLRWVSGSAFALAALAVWHLLGRPPGIAAPDAVLSARAAAPMLVAFATALILLSGRRAITRTMSACDAAQMAVGAAVVGMLALGPLGRVSLWSAAAVASAVGSRTAPPLRGVAAALAAAAILDARLLAAALALLAGRVPEEVPLAAAPAATAALAGWALLPARLSATQRLFPAVLAGLALLGAAAGLWPAAAQGVRGTVLLTAAAVAGLALSRRSDRGEVRWVAVGVLVLAGLRLAVVDLPAGRPGALFVSLVSYGLALLAAQALKRR